MTTAKQMDSKIAGVFLLAILASYVVLNRWMVTDIGLLSFGRVWQLYVSYSDFGFFRRGVVGTFLTVTGANRTFSNEYVFALVVQHVAIASLAFLVALFAIRQRVSNIYFVSSVALSPALIIQAGYTTGSLDIFVLMFATVNILFARNIIVFSTIIAVGSLTHELFVFTIPAQLAALLIRSEQRDIKSVVSMLALPIALMLAALAAILLWGELNIDRMVFDEAMASSIPNAVNQHPHWSGYFEVSSSVEENSSVSTATLIDMLTSDMVFAFLPIFYVILVTSRLLLMVRGIVLRSILAFASICPLFVSLIAWDFYRWIGISASMALLLSLLVASRSGTTDSRLNIIILLFCLLAPFGSAGNDRPFPMHQFLLERIGVRTTSSVMPDERGPG